MRRRRHTWNYLPTLLFHRRIAFHAYNRLRIPGSKAVSLPVELIKRRKRIVIFVVQIPRYGRFL